MTLWAHVPTPLASQQSSLFVVIQNLCTQRRAAGHASAVVVSDNRDIRMRDASLRAVDYTRYCPREWFSPREMYIDHLFGMLGRSRPYSSRMFIPAIEEIKELRPEIVILHEGHHATPSLPLWADRLRGSKIILYVHIPFSRGYRRRELRRLLSAASGIVFVSSDSLDRANEFLGQLPVPATVVNNGVDTESFNPEGREVADAFRLTFVGEISPHKGLHLLLASLRHLVKFSNRQFALQIVGQAGHADSGVAQRYEQQVRALASETPVDVRWIGFVEHDSMAAIYRASDVVCVPSIWPEPFGMVVLEALACGAAVVASPRGGLRDAGGEAAIYVEPTEEEHLARTIADLANDPEQLRQLQVLGREHAQQNRWASRYRQLAEAINGFLDT